jgi:hypothetical protein
MKRVWWGRGVVAKPPLGTWIKKQEEDDHIDGGEAMSLNCGYQQVCSPAGVT